VRSAMSRRRWHRRPNCRSETGERDARAGVTMADPSHQVPPMPAFQLVGLDPTPFKALFELSDDALADHGAVRHLASDRSGFPCRVGLEDSSAGDEFLLLPFVHQPASSPYRASGPIFVRRGALQCKPGPGEVPASVASRLLSVRAYDATHLIVDASVCEGTVVAPEIERLFCRQSVAYIHLHYARRGCFASLVQRA
jgi:hypothetical protein